MKFFQLLFLLLVISSLSGCANLFELDPPTPLPAEFLPTVVALTLEAGGVKLSTPTQSMSVGDSTIVSQASERASHPSTTILTSSPGPSLTSTPTASRTSRPSRTPAPSRTPTPETPSPTATTFQITLPPTPTETLPPLIPEARVQIYLMGELSKVRSPIRVSARLSSRVGKVARVELRGEDGRLLARNVRVFQNLPWYFANISESLEFEISAAAEVGRLIISVEDEFGRLMDLNSVNLILLSAGQTELNPTSALWQVIFIQEPVPQALIQGSTVMVSGLARPNTDRPLIVELVAEDGRVLGQRLAGISFLDPGGYGTFAAEVPYAVTEITPVRLIVYEDGENISEMTHLASVEILLSP